MIQYCLHNKEVKPISLKHGFYNSIMELLTNNIGENIIVDGEEYTIVTSRWAELCLLKDNVVYNFAVRYDGVEIYD